MTTRRFWLPLLLIAIAAWGCADGRTPSGAGLEPEATQGSDGSRDARTLPIPGGELPLDHPPADRGGSSLLEWDVPAGWRVEPPASSMRRAQYRLTGPAGDAECVVFYFGPGQGGDARSNAARWAGQFTQADGSPSTDGMTTTVVSTAQLPVQLVEVTGTYDGGMTMTDQPAQAQPGYMLLGAIVEGPDAPWFFKLTGPEPTIRDARDDFVKMMESIRVGG